MPTQKMLYELKRLLQDTGVAGDRHLSKIEADLIQTDILLDEAITKLTDGFLTLHKAIETQQTEFDLLLSGKKAATPENLAYLKSIREEINLHIHGAVTGLQFQDMTSQLLERVVRRVIGLREILSMVSASGNAIAPENNPSVEEIEILLHKMIAEMEEKMKSLESVLWRAVRQTRMESGDIDLF